MGLLLDHQQLALPVDDSVAGPGARRWLGAIPPPGLEANLVALAGGDAAGVIAGRNRAGGAPPSAARPVSPSASERPAHGPGVDETARLAVAESAVIVQDGLQRAAGILGRYLDEDGLDGWGHGRAAARCGPPRVRQVGNARTALASSWKIS